MCVCNSCYVCTVHNSDQFNEYLFGNVLQICFRSIVGGIWYQKQWEHNVPKIASSRYQIIPHDSWVTLDGKVTSCFHIVHLVLISVSKMSIVLGQCRQSEVQQVLMIVLIPMTFSDIWFMLVLFVYLVMVWLSEPKSQESALPSASHVMTAEINVKWEKVQEVTQHVFFLFRDVMFF